MKYYDIDSAPEWIQMIVLTPFIISFLPVPFALPFVMVVAPFKDISNLPVTIVYFIWISVAIFFMWMSNKCKNKL